MSGCSHCAKNNVQTFIISTVAAQTFLNSYSTLIYLSTYRYAKNHFIFVPDNDANELGSNFDDVTMSILNHSVILGINVFELECI